jgi:mannose-6-phosphate isomerase-like protein (cupin superfamily)
MSQSNNGPSSASALFDVLSIAAAFPDHAETMLLDTRLTDEPAASSRVFRVYKPVPAHFHKTCDEYLQVVSGRGKFVVEGNAPVELGPGQLMFFKRNTVHAIPEIVEGPLVFLAVDTPRRDPSDVTFVDPNAGTAATFIQTIASSKSPI